MINYYIIIRRTNYYSKIQDEDYINYQDNRIRSVKHSKRNNALGFGAVGGLLGAGFGSGKGLKTATALAGIGAGLGALGGYHLGKKIKHKVEHDARYRKNRYLNADEADRKYLRNQLNTERDLALKERQARAQEYQAYGSESDCRKYSFLNY